MVFFSPHLRWILTAAHCLKYRIPLALHLGLDSRGEYEKTIAIDPHQQFMYPRYMRDGNLYDIGLIKLPSKIQPGKKIRLVRLPSNCDEISFLEEIIAAGNGQSSPSQRFFELDPILQEISLRTVPCEKIDSLTANGRIDKLPTLICASTSHMRSTGSGDSGKIDGTGSRRAFI